MLTLKTASLRAALKCSASKDIRYYLNGVLVEMTATGRDIYTVATDGHILFAGKQDAVWTDEPKAGPWTVIIPDDILKTALRGYKGMEIHLDFLPDVGNDKQCQLGNVIFTPVDARFPDWQRVTPRGDMSGDAGQFNPAYLATCQDALVTWADRGKHAADYVYLAQNGKTSSALMTGSDKNAYCVIMPWRVDSGFAPFNLDTLPEPVVIDEPLAEAA